MLPNQADIQAILPTHELLILTKFHNVWVQIEDFLNNWPISGPVSFFITKSLDLYRQEVDRPKYTMKKPQ